MNWKKIAAVFMACGLMTGAASAQQPAAESYQNMLQQGKFQLEYTYEGESGLTRITTDKGMRLVDKQPDGKDWNLEAFAAGDSSSARIISSSCAANSASLEAWSGSGGTAWTSGS